MKTAEKIQVIVISVVLAVVLAILYGRLYPSPAVAPAPDPAGMKRDKRGDTDDAPIIMAGGSLHIGTRPDVTFQPDKVNQTVLEFPPNFRVFQINATDLNDKPYDVLASKLANGGSLVLTYCKQAGSSCASGAGKTDIITLAFDSATAPINLSNNLPGKPIGKMPRVLPYLRTHIRNKWKLLSITVKVSGMLDHVVTCGTDDTKSECYIVVHTCTGIDLTKCIPNG